MHVYTIVLLIVIIISLIILNHRNNPSMASQLLILMRLSMLMVWIASSFPLGAGSGWSASTLMDIAADLLQPSDDPSSRNADPLLDSMQSPYHKTKPKVVKTNFDGGDDNEKFLMPMLSNSVGDNNQLMEYMTAAVMARATKRTLCLTPFFSGPIKHTGKLRSGSLFVEDRYNMDLLSKFVNISSLQRCLHECHNKINGFWWLRYSSSSTLTKVWSWDSNVITHEYGSYMANWTSVDHVRQAIEESNGEKDKCVAVGGLFPGLRWRGAYLATSLYMRPSQSILRLADSLQNLVIGQDHKFLAVHWRFEESICKGNNIGLCFLRCGDGAIISSGLHATTRQGLPIAMKKERKQVGSSCKHMIDSMRVVVSKEDLVRAIVDKAFKENVSYVYISTDGWMRGPHAQNLIREVVKECRKRGLEVLGLWAIKDLPNMVSKGVYAIDREHIMKTISKTKVDGHSLSLIEQELCSRARSFMGSGESTWSLAVFRERLVLRRWNQLVNSGQVEEETIIKELLHDSHAAGLQCRYRFLYKRAKLNDKVAQESYQDEAPDTWLDMEACEAKLDQGGSCKLFDCSL